MSFHDIEELYSMSTSFYVQKKALSCDENPLIKMGVITHNTHSEFVDCESFKITDKAKRDLFSELKINLTPNEYGRYLLKHEKLTPKKLFYN